MIQVSVADPGISNWGVKISDIGCGDGKARAKNRCQMEKQISDGNMVANPSLQAFIFLNFFKNV